MKFFYIQDYKGKYRFFSSEIIHQPEVEFSKFKKFWIMAKKKLMLLPKRILSREQAFERTLKVDEEFLSIHFSGSLTQKKILRKFHFFLQRQRTLHIILLAIEVILLPISALMALIPGPNVFFGILALIIITHWQALKGLNSLIKKDHRFVSSPLIKKWELAVKNENIASYETILSEMEQHFKLSDLTKILWK